MVETIIDEFIAPKGLVCEKWRFDGLLLLPRVLAWVVVRVGELGVLYIVNEVLVSTGLFSLLCRAVALCLQPQQPCWLLARLACCSEDHQY